MWRQTCDRCPDTLAIRYFLDDMVLCPTCYFVLQTARRQVQATQTSAVQTHPVQRSTITHSSISALAVTA